MVGGTTEFRKWEGITGDFDNKKLYTALSEVAKGMENGGSSDTGGPNHIKVNPQSTLQQPTW